MKLSTIIVTLALIFAFSGCEKEPEKSQMKEPKKVEKEEIKPQSNYTIKDISSDAIYTLKRVENGFVVEGHEDKVIMFDFYATHCPPCKKEAPHLTNLQIKYNEKFLIIALNTFEDVTNQYVDNNFRFKYGAYYFIANSKYNEVIIKTVLEDIEYKVAMQIPFKVMLKNGKYQTLTDIYDDKANNKFYLGAIDSLVIEKDLIRILKQ